jgi:hypothetical protein
MPITIYTEQEISAQTLAFLRNRFPNRDTSTESFIGKLARTFAMVALGIQKSALDADNDAVPSSKTSTARLDEFAYVFGVLADTAGNYGRKGATVAGGGVGTITGTKATVYTAGSLLVGPDGVTLFKLNSNVTIPGIPPGVGSVTGNFTAVTPGTVGNISVGSVLTWSNPPGGSDSTVLVTSAFTGATDVESDQELLTRILLRLQNPPKGGVATDYRTWAEAVSGVSRAYVYPLRGGFGTVHVVITGEGSGTARDPGSSTKTDVDNYINGSLTQEGQRPVTNQGYTTYRPFLAATGESIKTRVIPHGLSNVFDWINGGAPLNITAYTPPVGVVPAKLTVDVVPATLASAIAAGRKPRLQIECVAPGNPVNQQVRATAFVGLVLDLENPLPTGFFAPSAADLVYPGGPIVDQIYKAQQTYIDSLGPSRQSGYYDPNDAWDDTIAVSRLIQVALDQVDSAGNRLASSAINGGTTINGATVDLEATDVTVNGPALLYAKHITVTD